MTSSLKSRLIPGMLTALIGTGLVWQGLHMPHERGWATSPSLFPIIIGSVLFLLAILLQLEPLPRDRKAPDSSSEKESAAERRRRVALTTAVPVSLAAYILLVHHIGFELATLGYLVAGMWALGERSLVRILVASLLFTAIIAFMFTQVLQTLLPGGAVLLDRFLN
ncbi:MULTISPECIES: tripartite tricarboxylate transporter TctB family protein [unclassified Nitratireductor]|uniref:tripartite tricarboxylate transporter TctB family protein n=1 Tax=unclassified Nitratireductor TaxID=2641084 RepID=UPI0025D40E9F|nr:tripartite tricarboxylate transporter TctB family protein [Nitratireductor sp.]